jgi:hypothetical protein
MLIDLRYMRITAILDLFGQQQHLMYATGGVSDGAIDGLDVFGTKEGNLSKRQNQADIEMSTTFW